MTTGQKWVLWLSAIFAVALFLVPPIQNGGWLSVFQEEYIHYSGNIDYKRFAIEYAILAFLSAVGYFTTGRKS